MTQPLAALQTGLGYQFIDPELLQTALRHPSVTNEPKGLGRPSNQRLEFLGDAVLELVVSEALFMRQPEASEGALAKQRAAIVSNANLAVHARTLGLDALLEMGAGQTAAGVTDDMLADALEAIIGAVYASDSYEAARDVATALLLD